MQQSRLDPTRSATPEGRAVFLAEASRLLAESLDYEATLATVARLAMPELGAWCIVDLLADDGSIRRLAIVHPDPAKQSLARELQTGYPPEMDDIAGAPRVLRTGRAEIVRDVGDATLRRAARDERHLEILRALGMGSFLVVPLEARGRLLGCMTFVSDSAERRYDETDLALAEDLARRAAMAVDNARLHRDVERARAEAVSATHAKNEFLAAMSHELRTPLNAIGGYAQLLELGIHGPVTEDQQQALERIRLNQTHLLRLVDDLLTFSRTEEATLPLDLGAVPLHDTLSRVHFLLDPLVRANGVSYAYEPCDPGLVVRADRDKLQQIVVNLLSNAVKFTPAGGRVWLRCRPDGDDMATIEVQDTGIGIPDERRDHIFEPFVQLSGGHTRTAEGAGLGLAISRGLARMMGGDLDFESEVGAGTTFRLTLPLARAARRRTAPRGALPVGSQP